MMTDVFDYVREKLPDCSDPLTSPVVMNHGSLGPITSKSIMDRKNEIDLFLSTRYILWKFIYYIVYSHGLHPLYYWDG